jgi:predicted nucleic acid-binding protein
MSVVVSDAGPIHYLVLTDLEFVLPAIFGTVIIPEGVALELKSSCTPEKVSMWMLSPPSWVEVQVVVTSASFQGLGRGETEAIVAARAMGAKLLVDDLRARKMAIALGLEVTGTIGILLQARDLGLINFAQSISRLRETNIHLSPQLLRWVESLDNSQG